MQGYTSIVQQTIFSNDLLQEIEIMQQLDDNNHILQLVGFVLLGESVALVLEFCAKGSLLNHLRNSLVDHKDAISYVCLNSDSYEL